MVPHRATPKPSYQVLHNNVLDKEVQSIAFSFNFALNLFFSSKWIIRDNHIYPNGSKYYWLSFCYLLVITALCLYRMFATDMSGIGTAYLERDFAAILIELLYSSYIIGFLMCSVLNVLHKHKNVFLILEIQTIYKNIDIRKSIRSYIIWNWISILTTIFCDAFLCSVHYALMDAAEAIKHVPDLICDLMFVTFNTHLVVAIRLIILLRKYLDQWIDDVQMMHDEQENDEQFLKLLQLYQHIFQAYSLYKDIFQALVLFQVLHSFLRSITFFDTIFYMMSAVMKLNQQGFSKNDVFILSLLIVVFTIRNTVFVIIHSVYCEKFYISVEEAKTACVQLMKNRNCTKSQKHLCMNVILTNRSFSKMSACGMFCVDATLTIGLTAVIVNYVLVLLQFFFL